MKHGPWLNHGPCGLGHAPSNVACQFVRKTSATSLPQRIKSGALPHNSTNSVMGAKLPCSEERIVVNAHLSKAVTTRRRTRIVPT